MITRPRYHPSSVMSDAISSVAKEKERDRSALTNTQVDRFLLFISRPSYLSALVVSGHSDLSSDKSPNTPPHPPDSVALTNAD